MTPLAPDPASTSTPRVDVRQTPSWASGVTSHDTVWYLATCTSPGCGPFGEPFQDFAKRDYWAVIHIEKTGHPVRLSTAVLSNADTRPALLMRTLLELGSEDGWMWVCLAVGCAQGADYARTGQLALADLHQHVCDSWQATQ